MTTIIQADRELAAQYLAALVPEMPKLAERVMENETALARAFAAHREASIAPLVEAMKRQAAAVRTLESAQSQELQVLRGKATEEYRAAATLDSEREANAMLTAEVERKTALLEEAERALEEMLAVTGEHDQYCTIGAFHNCTCDLNPAKERTRAVLSRLREGKPSTTGAEE